MAVNSNITVAITAGDSVFMKLRKEKLIPDTLSGRILMAVNLALAAAFAILAVVFRQDLFQGHMKAQVPVWLLWLICLFLIFWRPELPDRLSRPSAIVFALISPLYIVLCTEFIITSSSGTDGFLRKLFGPVVTSPKLLWVNYLLVGMIVLLMCGITNSLAYGPAVAAVICVGFSFCNYYIDEFRGSAITAFDFSTIGTAMEVAGGYHVRLTHRIFLSFLLVFLLALLGERHYRKRMAQAPHLRRSRRTGLLPLFQGLHTGRLHQRPLYQPGQLLQHHAKLPQPRHGRRACQIRDRYVPGRSGQLLS